MAWFKSIFNIQKIRMMKSSFLIVALLLNILLACSRSGPDDYRGDRLNETSPVSVPNEIAGNAPSEILSEASAPTATVASNVGKHIVKTAHVVLEVKHQETYSGYLKTTLQQFGAYVSREDNSFENDKRVFKQEIKVPVQLFDSLLERLSGKDDRLLQRNIETEDVTGSVIDTKSRLETRLKARDKYLELLQKVSKMEDVLKVQEQINNIQEEIESATARLEQLTKEASYSTIRLTFFEQGSGGSYYQNQSGFFIRIISAFVGGGKMFVDLLVGVVAIWPIGLVVILFVLILRKWKQIRYARAKKNV